MSWSMGIRPLGWDPTWTPDQLENALTDAGDKLYNFLLSRSSLVKKYLTYVDKGPQQGWVGREYENWARQFNDSQFMMGKYVNQLYGRAVDAHNAAVTARYEQEMRDLNKEPSWVRSKGDDQYFRDHRPYYGYIEPVRWDKAPVNTDPYNAEGANPECLSQYSCKTTQGNENIRAFFSTTLASAAAALPEEDNAPSSGGNPSASTLARAITYFLRYQVLELDARVGMIGKAFQEAGNQVPGTNFRTTTQQQLDQKIGDDEAPFARTLAQYASQHGIDNYVLQQLMIHQNDPYYTSVFFNSLDQSQLQDLLSQITHDSNPAAQHIFAGALASAYGSGTLHEDLQPVIANWLLDISDPSQSDPTLDFLVDLKANPTAAYNFIQSLHYPDQWESFANGLYYIHPDGTDPTGPPQRFIAGSIASAFMQDCAAALLGATSPTQANILMQQVDETFSQADTSDLTDPAVMREMLQGVTQLLENYEFISFTNPPNPQDTPWAGRGDQLTGWINTQSTEMANYAKDFGKWIYSAVSESAAADAFNRQLVEGIIIAGVTAALTPVDIPVAGAVTLAMGEAAFTGVIQPQIDSVLENWMNQPPSPNDPAMQQQNAILAAEGLAAKYFLTVQLYDSGQLVIWRDGQEVPITPDSTGVSSDQLLKWALQNAGGKQVESSAGYVVLRGTDGNTSLDSMLGDVGNSFSPGPETPTGPPKENTPS